MLALAAVVVAGSATAGGLSTEEQLGKSIFFDTNLSLKQNQACAACHAPGVGFTGPRSDINAAGSAYPGSVFGRFGNRKPPTAAYATPSPILHIEIEGEDALFVGGNFWDGRGTGEHLGNPAADQALGPFLNPVEQALSDNACVVYRVCEPLDPAAYPVTMEDVLGMGACDISWPGNISAVCRKENRRVRLSEGDRGQVNELYDAVGLLLAAYEASPEVNVYSSKYDYYVAKQVRLTSQEKRGLAHFRGNAKCALCHVLDPGPNGEPALFTDFTFDNLGVPRNPENPWYTMPSRFNPDGFYWIDKGLGGFLEKRSDYQQYASENYGKQKVPTLRNVNSRPHPDFVKAYMHDGYFKSLKGVVHFYNTRDVEPVCPDPFTTEAEAMAQDCWPEPEVAANVNTDELGDLGLSDAQEDDLVAFLKTLDDGYVLPDGGPQIRR